MKCIYLDFNPLISVIYTLYVLMRGYFSFFMNKSTTLDGAMNLPNTGLLGTLN